MPVYGLCVSLLVVVVVCSPDGCDEFCWNLLCRTEKNIIQGWPEGTGLPTHIRHPSQKVSWLKRGGSWRSTYGQDWQGTSSLLTRFAGRHFEKLTWPV